jgi:hypothetical protein
MIDIPTLILLATIVFVSCLWLVRHRVRSSEMAKAGVSLGALLTGIGMRASDGGDVRSKKGMRLDGSHPDGSPKASQTVTMASDR